MKNRIFAIILISVLVFSMLGCTKKGEYRNADVCGTFFEIELKCDRKDTDNCLAEIRECVLQLEKIFALDDNDSEISKFNRTPPGEFYNAGDDFYECMKTAAEIYSFSGGDFNPGMCEVSVLWGFSPLSTGGYNVPDAMSIGFALSVSDFEVIIFNDEDKTLFKSNDVHVDLGGIAKGYIVGKLKTIAERYSASGLINLGGNIYSLGASRIGVADPAKASTFMGIINIENTSICTSGNYERYFELDGVRYHHILGRDGYPANSGIKSVTIVGDDAALCDAISTAAFVGGIDSCQRYVERYNVGIIAITDDNKAYTFGIGDNFSIRNSAYKAV